jgi:hypothetical protein
MRPAIVILSLAAVGFSTTGHATVEVGGGGSALQVRASGDAISDIIAAISKVVTVRFRTSIPLETMIGGTYSGSTETVIARLLSNHNYSFAISHNREVIEVSVYGRWLEPIPAPVAMQTRAAPSQHPATPPQPNPNPDHDTRYAPARGARVSGEPAVPWGARVGRQ